MARPLASIDAEIANIEAALSSADSLISSVGSRGTNMTRTDRKNLEDRLEYLYQARSRIDGSCPQIVRGVVTGLRQTPGPQS